MLDRRVAQDDVERLRLQLEHRLERDVGRGFRRSHDEARVVLREHALGDLHVEMHREHHDAQEREQRHHLVAQGDAQRARIGRHHPAERALDDAVEAAVLLVLLRLEEVGADHRRHRQRHDDRHGDGHHQRHRELAQHASGDAAHEQHRNEGGDQRHADGDDGEADLPRADERGLHRRHAALDVAVDVLDHDDGVVDDEADGDGEGHQRQVVHRDSRAPT